MRGKYTYALDWEQRKFNKVLEYSVSTNTLSRAKLSNEPSDIKNIHYGDILVKYSAIVDVMSDDIPYVIEGKIEHYKTQVLRNGDIIIADTAENFSVGKVIEIMGIMDVFVVSGLHTIAARPSIDFAPKYLGYYLNSPSYRSQLFRLMQGIKVLSLSKTNLAKTEIMFPRNINEQQQIGALIYLIDKLITLHQRKLETLKHIKQGYLQQLFPQNGGNIPTLRFADFEGDWEQRKLNEIAEINPKSELPWQFEYVDLESVMGTEMISHREENRESAPSRAQRLAIYGDLFYQTVRPYQKNNYLFEKTDKDYVFSTGYAQLRPRNDGYFLLSLVQTERFVNDILDRCTGTSYPAINSGDLAEIDVLVPKEIAEARSMGLMFRKLDHLITLHQEKLNALNLLKQSYLQKMFI